MKKYLLTFFTFLLLASPVELSARHVVKHHRAHAQAPQPLAANPNCAFGTTPPSGTSCSIGDYTVGGALSSTDAIAICQVAGGCFASSPTITYKQVPILSSVRGALSAGLPLSYNSGTGAFSWADPHVSFQSTFTRFNYLTTPSGMPTPQAGAVIQIGGPDGSPARFELDAFGGAGRYIAGCFGGTSAAPVPLNAAALTCGGFNGWAYDGSSLVGPLAGMKIVTAEPQSSGHGGMGVTLQTTPIGSTTPVDGLILDSTQNITVAGQAGTGTRCIHVDATGKQSATASDCGSGGGGFTTNNVIPKGNGSTLVSSGLTDNGTTVSTTEAAQVASLQVTNQAGTGVRCIHADAAGNQSAAAGDCATGGSGSVTSVAAGTGLTASPSPITTTGTLSLTNTAVSPGSYTNTNLTVNAQGQITAASNGSAGSGGLSGMTAGQVPIAATATTVTSSLPVSTTAAANTIAEMGAGGTLAAGMMPAYTGQVTSPAGSTVNTITANTVTNANLAQMAANTIKGNPTGALANGADMTVPSCADTAGNHLNWTSGTGLSCGTTSSGGAGVTFTASTPNMVVTGSGSSTLTVGTTAPTNPQAGASYTVAAGDVTKTVLMTNASPTTVAVPQAIGSFANGFAFDVQTTTAGQTLTSTTSQINGIAGATGIKAGPHQTTAWLSDGANWQVGLGVPQPATQTGTTFLRDDMTWQAVGGASTSSPNTWTAAQTFGQVYGGARTVTTGTTDTLLATDCGQTVYYNLAAFTVTVPSTLSPGAGKKCDVTLVTNTANKVTVTGSGMTIASADSYTGTQNIVGSGIVVEITTIGSTASAFLFGHGS